jgi:hypothetical protein
MKDKEKEEEEIFQIPCEGKTDVLRWILHSVGQIRKDLKTPLKLYAWMNARMTFKKQRN